MDKPLRYGRKIPRSSRGRSTKHGVYVVNGLAYMLVAHKVAVRICLDTRKKYLYKIGGSYESTI